VGPSYDNNDGRPEYMWKPCPPAALLKISMPLNASVVNTAFTPLVKE